MNSNFNIASRLRMRVTSLAFCGLLALTPAMSLADRGRGSIRGADRAAPEPERAPERAPEPDRAPPPPDRAPDRAPDRVPDHPEPLQRPDIQHPGPVGPPPHVDVPGHRDWDDNDEDARNFGGFGHGAVVRAIRGQRLHDLPPSHRDIFFNNIHYFCDDDGVYYLAQPDGEYLVVQPPVGVTLAALPAGVTGIVVGPTTYYYLDGVFYAEDMNGFAVVSPPPGIVVPALPTGATQVVINGVVTYQFDGFNYQPSIQDGVTAYTVTPS